MMWQLSTKSPGATLHKGSRSPTFVATIGLWLLLVIVCGGGGGGYVVMCGDGGGHT